jgi:hypothetical protein
VSSQGLLPHWGGPHEIITGISQGTSLQFPIPSPLAILSGYRAVLYKETGLNDANVFSRQITALNAGIFSMQENDKRITHP